MQDTAWFLLISDNVAVIMTVVFWKTLNLGSNLNLEQLIYIHKELLIVAPSTQYHNLKTWLMRPYPANLSEEQTVYNFRQSRLKRVIENFFGVLASSWRIFSFPINASVENIERYVKSAILPTSDRQYSMLPTKVCQLRRNGWKYYKRTLARISK